MSRSPLHPDGRDSDARSPRPTRPAWRRERGSPAFLIFALSLLHGYVQRPQVGDFAVAGLDGDVVAGVTERIYQSGKGGVNG